MIFFNLFLIFSYYNQAVKTKNTTLFKRNRKEEKIMKKITQVLNSPIKIAAFVVCAVLIAAAIGLATVKVGANVNANKTIGMDKGVAVALADAGFTSEQVTDLVAHYDDEDGYAVYEVDFTANGYEYDYTVKASDGKILEAQREKADDNNASSDSVNNSDSDSSATTGQSPQQSSNGSTSSNNTPASRYIGVDKAKSIALKDAGVSASSVKRYSKAKLDRDDGVAVYEIEFYTDSMEYEYEINATTGKIMDRDAELRDYDDDWDDDYDDEWDD